MKKFNLLLLLVLSFQFLKAQDNYFKEASAIAGLVKNPNLSYRFTFDAQGYPVPHGTDTISTNRLSAAMAFLTKASASLPAPSDTSAVHKTGANGKQAPVAIPPNTTEGLTASLNSQLDGTHELYFALFLLYDNEYADYQKVMPLFPKKFQYIGTSTLALFQSGSATTGFNFDQIVLGLTKMIADRAKKELVNTYLSEWQTKLSQDAIVGPILPQTLSVFSAFNNDNTLNLSQYGEKWKTAFQEDLRNIPVKLQDEKYVTKVLTVAGMSGDPLRETSAAIAGGDQLVYNLYLKKHLVSILRDMSTNYLLANNDRAIFKRLVVFANLLAKSGGSLVNNTYQGASQVTDDAKAIKVLLRLLFLRDNKALLFAFNQNDPEVIFNQMIKTDTAIDRFTAIFNQGVSLINTYQSFVSNTAQQSTVTLSVDDVHKIFDLSFQLVDQAKNLAILYGNLSDIQKTALVTNYDKVQSYYKNLSEIGVGIATKQYGQVLDGSAALLQLLKAAQPADGNHKVLDDASSYLQIFGSFMLNILNATTSDQVEAALNELTPQDQYQLKNSSIFSLSVSSYPGVFVGLEALSKATNSSGSASLKSPGLAFSPGVYLPIGIDASWGSKSHGVTSNNTNKYSSWNILLQAVDLGAVLDYRVTNSSAQDAQPNFTFRQLLSPGLALIHHFDNSPFVLGAGMNYTPQLRTLQQDNVTYQANAFRFGIFAAVDVTFFNIFSKKRN